MSGRYTDIWNQLKKTGNCRITAPKVLHKRILKAVCKEKHKDAGYSFVLSEEGMKARLETEYDGSVIKFTLRKSMRLDNL